MAATGLEQYLTPQVIFCAGILMLVVVVMRMRARSRKMDTTRGQSVGGGGTTNAATARDVMQMAQELNSLLVELQETSRRIAAQIDNRYSKLDAMLAEADERIRRLEQLNGPGGADAPAMAAANRAAPPPASLLDPKYKPIYELADKGKSPREIAQELGTQPGEVELILNLRGSQRVG
jgi:hypothetical protein